MVTHSTNKHGGKRKGAGKPAQYSEAMVKVDFMLPKEAIEFFTTLGDGNRSEGARRAWRSLTKRAPDARESGAKIVKSKSKRSVKPARG